MKILKPWLLFALLFLIQITMSAQNHRASERKTDDNNAIVNAKHLVNVSFAQSQLQITNLRPKEIDKIIVLNMQGAPVLQQVVKSVTVTLDLSTFNDGVYLLVLRSSMTMKEKTFKFVVRK